MNAETFDFLVPVIEWTWSTLAVFGVLLCIWVVIDGKLDQRSQQQAVERAISAGKEPPNGDAKAMTEMILRSAYASSYLHTFFLVLGVFALISPDQHFSPTLGVLGASYILVAFTNVRALFLNQLKRVRIRRGSNK